MGMYVCVYGYVCTCMCVCLYTQIIIEMLVNYNFIFLNVYTIDTLRPVVYLCFASNYLCTYII